MTEDRYARVCPQHGVVLEERGSALFCSRGQHCVKRWNVVDTQKRKVLAQADEKKEEVHEMNVQTRTGPKKPKTETLEKSKFGDDEGNVLWIRVICHRSKRGGETYQVRWARHEAGAKNGSTTGAIFSDIYQEKARTAYGAEVKDAQKDGWEPLPLLMRRTFKPIPKPAKKVTPLRGRKRA